MAKVLNSAERSASTRSPINAPDRFNAKRYSDLIQTVEDEIDDPPSFFLLQPPRHVRRPPSTLSLSRWTTCAGQDPTEVPHGGTPVPPTMTATPTPKLTQRKRGLTSARYRRGRTKTTRSLRHATRASPGLHRRPANSSAPAERRWFPARRPPPTVPSTRASAFLSPFALSLGEYDRELSPRRCYGSRYRAGKRRPGLKSRRPAFGWPKSTVFLLFFLFPFSFFSIFRSNLSLNLNFVQTLSSDYIVTLKIPIFRNIITYILFIYFRIISLFSFFLKSLVICFPIRG